MLNSFNHDKLLSSILKKDNNYTPTKYRIKLKSGKFPNIINYLNNRYIDSDSISETLSRMKYGLENRPVCKICGGHVKYLRTNGSNLIYQSCCSAKCGHILGYQKSKETCLKKYGVENGGGSKQALEKIKQTKLRKYGDPNYMNRKKIFQTCLEKYGRKSGFNYQKSKETCLKKYGVENGGGSKQALEKISHTIKEKYGVEFFYQSKEFKEKSKETCLKKYGVEYPSQSNEIKEKTKKTCLERYGVEYATQSNEIKEKISRTNIIKYGSKTFCESNEYYIKKNEIVDRIYNTRKKNNSINTSKPEEELYLYIKEKFPTVRRQYKDNVRYPWRCDFYIPEIDCFIEYQGFQGHGKHPYDSNSIQDQVIVERWKQRYENGKHPLYKRMIEGWTICDVKKRNKAKQENLNFYEFWNLYDAKKFIDNLWQI